MNIKLFAIFLFYILLIESAFSQNKTFLPKDYEKKYFDYSETEELKPRRNKFKWLKETGLDSIAVEVGINRYYTIPHKIIPCGTGTCSGNISVKTYSLLDYNISVISYDYINEYLVLTKGVLLIRRKGAVDYFNPYLNRYGYSEGSVLRLQLPLQIGLKMNNFHAFAGLNLGLLEFYKLERREEKNNYSSRQTSLDLNLVPSVKVNYIRKFKSFIAGTYMGADLNDKYYVFGKFGFLVFIR